MGHGVAQNTQVLQGGCPQPTDHYNGQPRVAATSHAAVAIMPQDPLVIYREGSVQYKLAQMIPPPNTYPLLESIHLPADLRKLPQSKLQQLADELRQFLIQSVSTRGGHFAAGLGTVELTIALHYIFNTPDDRLVWDVGHQAYPHKVLTGRRELLHTIKQDEGLAPFPTRSESEYDTFGVGHSSTSISAALGMAIARRQAGRGSPRGRHHRRRRDHGGHGVRGAESRRISPPRTCWSS